MDDGYSTYIDTRLRELLLLDGQEAFSHYIYIRGMGETLSASFKDVSQWPLKDRFAYITAIKLGIERRFREEPETKGMPILESEIKLEVTALLKLTSTIQPSENYLWLIERTVNSALDELLHTLEDYNVVQNWPDTPIKFRGLTLQRFHNLIIENVKKEIGYDSDLSKLISKFDVNYFPEPLKNHPNGTSTILHGYAQASGMSYPGAESLALNTHEHAKFDSANEAFGTMAHETAHIIEGFISFFYKDHADLIPIELQSTARSLFYQKQLEATIPSRIFSVYPHQCNETVAHFAGDVASFGLKEKLKNPTPPALS